MIRRLGRWAASAALAAALALGALWLATTRGADPALYPAAQDVEAVSVEIVSHGWHAGFAISAEALAASAERQGLARLPALLTRFSSYPQIEIGWGDERFYQETPGAADVQVASAFRALFLPGNRAVMHVVGLERPAVRSFPHAEILRMRLSVAGFDRLVRHIDSSLVEPPLQPVGAGLYGPSLFFAAEGWFSILQVCNHWVASGLAAAGVPHAPVAALHPWPFFAFLEARAGAQRLR